MNRPTLTSNSLESPTYNPDKITYRSHDSKSAIIVSELEFETLGPEQRRIEAPQNGLLFVYNLKEKITYRNHSNNKKQDLGSFESTMVSSDHKTHLDLNFSKNGNYHLCIIVVNKLENLGEFKPNFLSSNFNSQKNSHCWFTGTPNIKLSNFVKDLINLKTTQANNHHLLLGYTNIIIGSKLAEYSEFMNAPKKQIDLRTEEIDRIHECIDYVKENFAQQLDIDTLCSKTALSPQKLQTGFRELYGATVSSFIKNLRLQKSEELMRTTELNVSEIVYSIGFTSRSYFSKIFKEKFETSPNNYIKKFKYVAA